MGKGVFHTNFGITALELCLGNCSKIQVRLSCSALVHEKFDAWSSLYIYLYVCVIIVLIAMHRCCGLPSCLQPQDTAVGGYRLPTPVLCSACTRQVSLNQSTTTRLSLGVPVGEVRSSVQSSVWTEIPTLTPVRRLCARQRSEPFYVRGYTSFLFECKHIPLNDASP